MAGGWHAPAPTTRKRARIGATACLVLQLWLTIQSTDPAAAFAFAKDPAPVATTSADHALCEFKPGVRGFFAGSVLKFVKGGTLQECAARCLSWKVAKACRAFQYSAVDQKCSLKKVRPPLPARAEPRAHARHRVWRRLIQSPTRFGVGAGPGANPAQHSRSAVARSRGYPRALFFLAG